MECKKNKNKICPKQPGNSPRIIAKNSEFCSGCDKIKKDKISKIKKTKP